MADDAERAAKATRAKAMVRECQLALTEDKICAAAPETEAKSGCWYANSELDSSSTIGNPSTPWTHPGYTPHPDPIESPT